MAPPRRSARPFCSLNFLGILLLALSTFSDACEEPPQFLTMDIVQRIKPEYNIGEEVTYTCAKGYFYVCGKRPTRTVCAQNNSWLHVTDDCCFRLSCRPLQNPTYGQVKYLNGSFGWGFSAHFTCNSGFYLVGESILHCELKEKDAYWSGKAPVCEKIKCKPPPKIKNGKHTFANVQVFDYYATVTYSCDPSNGPDEYSLVGPDKIYCVNNNKWSDDAPECKVVKCPYPTVKNGKQISGMAKKFYYKATVIFECKSGHYLHGSDTSVCQSNNTWYPPLPTCPKVLPPPSTTLSHSVSTPPSTIPPISSVSGYPNPKEGFFDIGEDLGPWVIVLIIVTLLVGVAVICIGLYRCFERRKKKGTYVTGESYKEVNFTSL
ncbi:membrane cofactor protein isoform X2 [Nycticebus coucang]|uniref:membrane cofactor protein isoform X2 n=1 Tax=Nycticebus coucang TaxID=9470 RepID=UPI00234D312E|nr:membrane cofactor protein isoform X2 [Nycticebus coucang]